MIYNEEAERSVLGAILIDGSLIKETKLRPEHFFEEVHRVVFKAMREVEKDDEPIDLVTVVTRLQKSKTSSSVGVAYLTNLGQSVPTTANFSFYEAHVINAWKLRQAMALVTEFKAGIKSSADVNMIGEVIANLSRVDEVAFDSDFEMRKALLEVYDDLMSKQVEAIEGISTGYTDLDAFTNGMKNQDLIILAARPSVGKTAFALNIGAYASDKEDTVTAIFSLEMNEKSLLKRLISAYGRIDATKLRNPERFFTEDDHQRLTMAMGSIEKWNLFIYDKPSVTINEIRAKLRQLKKKFPGKRLLCIIDYLQLIQPVNPQPGNRAQEISDISRGLKLIARDLDIPVVALSQLSRSVESRQNKRPMLSDLRESGSIEQDADLIAFLYRDDYYDKETSNRNIVEIIIGKQRNGPTGTVELAFLKEYNKFVSLDHRFRQTTIDEVGNGKASSQ
ncbi:replicative DNA helicase [Brevibacillus sp. HD3.3A]|uniref:replicative DNA helicase n=1 Tax=Brevibacillus sp. HD3.3A TaxID=2738979 RepID=UPI00156A9A1E|nr:replicative DNA helicase [Brevibacillus sp. HD3.3A]UED72116.1 replicative DNA helicase [Brevibacillus sp. HD3.3A]